MWFRDKYLNSAGLTNGIFHDRLLIYLYFETFFLNSIGRFGSASDISDSIVGVDLLIHRYTPNYFVLIFISCFFFKTISS